MSDILLTERQGAILVVTMNRPERKNAFTRPMLYKMEEVLQAAADGTLDAARFAALYRARRDYLPYLRNLSQAVNAQGRERLLEAVCANVSARMSAPRFARRLERIRARREAAVTEVATATG